MSAILRAILTRWYVLVAGVLLSLVAAGTVHTLIPTEYSSSGIALLIEQKKPGVNPATNPMLAGDGSLNTATITLVQALSAPVIGVELGLVPGEDSFTIKNVGSAAIADGADHPFLYVTTQSTSAQRSAEIVGYVINKAREELSGNQNALNVPQRYQIRLQSVVDATAPTPVVITKFALTGATLLLGVILSCIIACAWNALLARRARRSANELVGRAFDGDLSVRIHQPSHIAG
jgi:hypothetical protein